MKYIRTKDGIIVDIEKFINEEKDTPYYKDFEFEEISKDGELKWTAVGTEQNSMEEQRGIRCHFSATLNSEVIKQADTIEEMCDEFVIDNPLNWRPFPFTTPDVDKVKLLLKNHPVSLIKYNIKIFGAIWTAQGLIYVAKLNEKGELELI